MNKQELIKAVKVQAGLQNMEVATAAVEAVFDTILEATKSGDKVKLAGFGTFDTKEVKSSTKRNPKTGAEVITEDHTKRTFKYSESVRKLD